MLDAPAAEIDLGATRRRILECVRERGPMTPKTLADVLDLTEENASPRRRGEWRRTVNSTPTEVARTSSPSHLSRLSLALSTMR